MARKHRILIIHERSFIGDFWRVFGSTRQYVIQWQFDPNRGADAAAVFKPDLIITDALLKEKDGEPFARRLRNAPGFATIPIVLFTRLVPEGEIKELEGFPALGRPAKLAKLREFIQTHLPKLPVNSVATADPEFLLARAKPIRLEHCLSGWPPRGPNNFRSKNDHLSYWQAEVSPPHYYREKVVVPTVSQWQRFWRVCDEIDVWSWPPTLGDFGVIDGLQWGTTIEIGDWCVESEGQVTGSPSDFDEKLKRLHHALQEITGWQLLDNDW